VQIALKPASKTLGLHGVFKRGKGRKYLIADSAFKRCKSTTQARTGSMLTSIIWALHFGQAGRSIATNAMTDRRERNTSLSPVCTETLAASSHRSNAPIKRKSPSILRKIVALTPLKLTSDPQIG